jgi:hypothetical protein
LALRSCVRIMFAHRVDIQIVPKQFGKGGNKSSPNLLHCFDEGRSVLLALCPTWTFSKEVTKS